MSARVVPAVVCALLALAGCQAQQSAAPRPPSTPSATPSGSAAASPPAPSTSRNAPSTTRGATPTRARARPAAGRPVVVLDPGHNGGNASHPEQINGTVPAGRGRTKPCNTTGTSTDGGYPEHAFTWDVAQRAGKVLSARGFRVLLTRDSDTGVGPCVNQRAAAGNSARAAAVVSIHADGSASSAHGFHVSYSAPPLNPAQGAPSHRLARDVRSGMSAAGFDTSSYLGSDGLYPRDDLGGLNLSTRPSVLVECGNMRNPDEAAAFTSPSGRQHYARAIAGGIAAYLGG